MFSSIHKKSAEECSQRPSIYFVEQSIEKSSSEKLLKNVHKVPFVRMPADFNEFVKEEEDLSVLVKDETLNYGKLVFSTNQQPFEDNHFNDLKSLVRTEFSGDNSLQHALNIHERSDSASKTHTCSKCNESFWELTELLNHKGTIHHMRSFECYFCRRRFTIIYNLKNHFRLHDGRPLKCTKCSASFYSNSSLYVHYRRIHGTTKPHSCSVCGERFSTKRQVIVHEGKMHNVLNYECKVCGKRFALEYNLIVHYQIHSAELRFQRTQCSAVVPQENRLKQHVKEHVSSKILKCFICSKMFVTKIAMNTHEKTHTGNLPSSCYKCFTDGRKGRPVVTLKYVKHDTRHFECYLCGRPYAFRCKLSSHYKMHSAARPHRCKRRTAGFFRKDKLKEHLQKHDNNDQQQEAARSCNDYDEQQLKSNLTRHYRAHDPSFVCIQCSEAFHQLDELKKHMQVVHEWKIVT